MTIVEEELVVEPPATNGWAVETRSLRKTYGSLVALEELDLRVPHGAIFGLIGPNGAGKTTTFSILATLLAPSSGVALVDGFNPSQHPQEVRRALGYMPDFFGVYDDVRVWEYLDFFAAAYRIPPAERRGVVRDLLELVDLAHKRDDFVEALSRGMKQRLGLARALVHDPRVLILDEPASGLDPRARVELRELLLELQSMGKTVLISSHILSELEEVCDYIGILEAGRMLMQGRPGDIATPEGTRTFIIRLANDAGDVNDALAGLDSVLDVARSGRGWRVIFTGDDETAAALLSRLTAAGLAVVEFREERSGLEDLFMKVTRGIVQ